MQLYIYMVKGSVYDILTQSQSNVSTFCFLTARVSSSDFYPTLWLVWRDVSWSTRKEEDEEAMILINLGYKQKWKSLIISKISKPW